MDTFQFDRISKAFAQRRVSRRQALKESAAGLAAASLAAVGLASYVAAQDATPEAAPDADIYDPSRKVPYLFVQSFEGGTIAPKDGEDGTYTVSLTHGLGQTIYFSDRPLRDVGATPTPQFLEGLGFSATNPPNAALLMETAPGETDIAVVELLNPVYHPAGPGVTYDVKVLANWEDSTELGFTVAPLDLAAVAASFGSAHLFIDDCADSNLSCCPEEKISSGWFGSTCREVAHDFGTVGYCYQGGRCVPCEPYYHDAPSWSATWNYWRDWCNAEIPACNTYRGCVAGYWV